MTAKIILLQLKVKSGEPMREVAAATADGGQGLVGDASYGRGKRQVLFIEKETLDDFGLMPGQLRENVTVIGAKLAGLPKGMRLQAGSAEFEVTGDCAPCEFVDSLRPGLRAAIAGRRGTLCRVVTDGELRVGDEVKLLAPIAE